MAKRRFDTKNESDENSRELGNRKKLTKHDLVSFSPKTASQEQFEGFFMRNFDIIFQRGSAGTGKSAMALYYSMLDVFNPDNRMEKIVYVKPCVEERKRGFVPGDLTDKEAQFEVSVRETVNDLLKFNDGYSHAKSLGYIEFMTTGLRGRTFKDTIVILDEAQNYDYTEIKTVAERVGEGSRLIICGDERQNDLKRHRETSGLNKFIEVMKTAEDVSIGIVNYAPEDNVRGGISRAVVIADYYYEED